MHNIEVRKTNFMRLDCRGSALYCNVGLYTLFLLQSYERYGASKYIGIFGAWCAADLSVGWVDPWVGLGWVHYSKKY